MRLPSLSTRLAAAFLAARSSALLLGLLALLSVAAPAAGQDGSVGTPHDSAHAAVAGRCPQGRISRIDVENGSVLQSHASDSPLLRRVVGLANRLHVRTRQSFIRRSLLFAEGDCYDPFLVEESRNVLEGYDFISHARIVTEGDSTSDRRVVVQTQDEWTTRLDVGVTYDAGLNLENLNLVEDNLLGRGLVAHAEYRSRREVRRTLLGLRQPNAFLRTEVALYGGSSPEGNWIYQALGHPWVGRVGRFSGGESWVSQTTVFSYATDGAQPWAHVLESVREQHAALSGATRFGEPRGMLIVGALATRDVYRPQAPEVSLGGFDDRVPPTAALPAAVARQAAPSAATRIGLRLGVQGSHDARYEGLDAVRDLVNVGLGYGMGVVVGRSLPILAPAGVRAMDDVFGRFGGGAAAAIGPLLVLGSTTVEVRRVDDAWRDLIAGADVVTYLPNRLPGQIIFVRGSLAGGWWTTIPFQLTLGGREGVRSLGDDALPGGRQLLLVAEDRIRFGWLPANAVDLGATLFTDWGRVWAGDAPYGVNSGWRGAAGFGLRLAFPTGSRNVWRPDLVFPVGPGAKGGPIFRVTMELNRIRSGFSTPDVDRSRRFNIGL